MTLKTIITALSVGIILTSCKPAVKPISTDETIVSPTVFVSAPTPVAASSDENTILDIALSSDGTNFSKSQIEERRV